MVAQDTPMFRERSRRIPTLETKAAGRNLRRFSANRTANVASNLVQLHRPPQPGPTMLPAPLPSILADCCGPNRFSATDKAIVSAQTVLPILTVPCSSYSSTSGQNRQGHPSIVERACVGGNRCSSQLASKGLGHTENPSALTPVPPLDKASTMWDNET